SRPRRRPRWTRRPRGRPLDPSSRTPRRTVTWSTRSTSTTPVAPRRLRFRRPAKSSTGAPAPRSTTTCKRVTRARATDKMAFDLNRRLAKAFHVTEVTNATEALHQASEKYIDLFKVDGMSFEVAPPASPDENWAKERLLHPLIYYCESSGRTFP